MSLSSHQAVAEVYDTAGVYQGKLAFLTAFSVRKEIDAVGRIQFTIPNTGTEWRLLLRGRANVTLKANNNGVWYTLGHGVVTTITLSADGKNVQVDCDEILAELRYTAILKEREYVNDPADDVIADLIGDAPLWSATCAETDEIYLTTEKETVLQALQRIAAHFELHFRTNGLRELEIAPFGDDSGWKVVEGGGHITGLGVNTLQAFNIKQVIASDELCTRVFPLGTSYSGGVLTLKDANAPAIDDYVVQNRAYGTEGKVYYIEAADELDEFGVFEARYDRPDIQPKRNTTVSKRAAANALYRAAVTYLKAFKQPVESFVLDCAGWILASDEFAVGDKIRVQWASGVPSYTGVTTTNISVENKLWYIVAVETILADSRLITRLEIANVLRPNGNLLTRTGKQGTKVGEEIGGLIERETEEPGETVPEEGDEEEIETGGPTIPPYPPGTGTNNYCAAANFTANKFWAWVQDGIDAIDAADGLALEEATFIDTTRINAGDYGVGVIDNVNALTDPATMIALRDGVGDTTTLAAQITSARKEELARWLFCQRGGLKAADVVLWITNRSGWPTPFKTLALKWAEMAGSAWGFWYNTGLHGVDNSCTTASWDCDEEYGRVLAWTENNIWRSRVGSTSTGADDWDNITPNITGGVMHLARSGDEVYAVVADRGANTSQLWYTENAFANTVTWKLAQDAIDGVWTRVAVSSTSGAGWMYAPRFGWRATWDFTTTSGASDGWTSVDDTAYWSGNTGSWSNGVGWVTNDRSTIGGEYGRIVQIKSTALADLAIYRLATSFSYTKGTFTFPYPYNYGAFDNAGNFDAINSATITNGAQTREWLGTRTLDDYLRVGVLASYQTSLAYNGAATLTAIVLHGTGNAPSFVDATVDTSAITRYFTSNGDTIADPVIVGTGYTDAEAIGALSANGTSVFAASADKLRFATSGGAYADYETVDNVIDVHATSTTEALYATALAMYYDGTDITANDGSNDGLPTGNECITYTTASTRTFYIGTFGGVKKIAYSDDGGATWSFNTDSTLANGLLALDDDVLYVAQGNIFTAKVGDVTGTLADVASPIDNNDELVNFA